MALTMTRTRTQTTLTKLAELVANVHGELEFVEGLLRCLGGAEGEAAEGGGKEEVRARLEARRLKLVADRDALYATVRQFDPELDTGRIGSNDEWQRRFGRAGLSRATLARRYLSPLRGP